MLALLGGAAAAAFVLAVSLGPVWIPPADLFLILSGQGSDVAEVTRRIVLEVRLPRAVMGACVGALLATSGVLLQGFLRNPLAEPYLLGISSGAGLAVTAAIILGLPFVVAGIYVVPVFAFLGALLTLTLVYFLAQFRGRLMVTTLILAGVVVSAFLSALIMFLASVSTSRFLEILSWLMGHLQPVTRGTEKWILVYTGVGFAAAWAQARDLNALLVGEDEAASLGVRVEALKKLLFILASLLTGIAVSVSGLIGFVGLVAPHTARLLVGTDHRRLVPAAALAGAAMLMIADVAARLVFSPAELPVGVVTALVGGPFFLVLLFRHVRELSRVGKR